MARPKKHQRLVSLRIGKGVIRVRHEEAPIDHLAWEFCAQLDRKKVTYAIVGGYVALLLGSARQSEDVDLVCKKLSFNAFSKLHASLTKHFDCVTPGPARRLYQDFLDAGPKSTAIRYARKGKFYPNVEFKFAQRPLDHHALRKRIAVDANGHKLYIGPLEEMIAFKLWMGSRKDFEDARWIYRSARGRLREVTIRETAHALGVTQAKRRKILGR